MKKWLSALLVPVFCLSAALAELDPPADEAENAAPPAVTATPEPEQEVAPDPIPLDSAEEMAAPIDDMMLPEGSAIFVMPVPEIGAQPEGYVLDGGARRDGTLEELLSEAGKKTVYVTAKEPVRIEKFLLALLKDVELLPDAEFGESYAVALATDQGPLSQEAIDAAVDEEVTLIVSVAKQEPGAEPEPGEKPGEQPGDAEIRLKVTPRGFADGVWQSEMPSFLLEGIPEDAGDFGYAAIIYDERIIPLAGDEYFSQEEGTFVVRFAILDALGDIVDKSEKYLLLLDFTAPELAIDVSAEHDYTMTLSAADALSGVIELSLDGGESWVPLNEGESVVHTEARRKVFAPGMIQVCDLAGNIGMNFEEIVLDAIPRESYGGGGWGGGGGDGSSGEKKPPHSRGDGDTAPYDAYELALPEGAVEVLTLGGEEIDLGLEIEGEEIAGDAPALFTAELTSWAVENPLAPELEPEKDTLVVRAEVGEGTEPFTCTWRINGAVLRKLYNTDISYLALAAGDAVLSLPTVGFTAGTRYAELKMEGVSTAEFEYEIVMRIDPDAEGPTPAEDGWNLVLGCEPELHVEVAGERFDMIDRVSTPEMYPFDVYCGPTDLPKYPYGEYPRAEVEVW